MLCDGFRWHVVWWLRNCKQIFENAFVGSSVNSLLSLPLPLELHFFPWWCESHCHLLVGWLSTVGDAKSIKCHNRNRLFQAALPSWPEDSGSSRGISALCRCLILAASAPHPLSLSDPTMCLFPHFSFCVSTSCSLFFSAFWLTRKAEWWSNLRGYVSK